MKQTKTNRFLLLYASQTGQAKAIAEEINENAPQHGLNPELHCISQTEKKFSLERESCVVIVTSTTGEGEPPDTALKFWRRLKKKTLPDDHLSKVNYALLGLGDSNYTNFCNNGKNFDKRLNELGAKRFYECGWADEAVGLEVKVEPWIEGLFTTLRTFLNLNCNNEHAPLNGASNIETEESNSTQITDSHVKKPSLEGGPSNEDTSTESSQCITQTITPQTEHTSETPDNPTNAAITSELNTENKKEPNEDKGNEKSQDSTNCDCDTVDHTIMPSIHRSIAPLSESALTLPLLTPAFYKLTFHPGESLDLQKEPIQNGSPFPSAKSDVVMATVTSATILTRHDAVKTALDVGLDISSSSIKYQPGDSFGIICPNTDQDVTTLIERLEVADQADTVFTLDLIADTKKRNAVIPSFIHEKTTLRHSLTTCFDLRAVPKKAFIRVLAEYTKDPGEKRRLQNLCSKQGAKDYTEFIREQNISVLDILLAFPSCLPPLERFLEQLTRLQPRPYSISSSPLHSSSLHFVFNIVEIPAGSGRSYARKGLCTGWLNSITKTLQKSVDSDLANGVSELTLETSDVKIPIFTRSNQNFHLPEDISRPIIMIGPGTGVAPFVGFLQHREQQRKTGSTIGESWLFFGCRNKEKDFLYEKQLVDLGNSGVLTKFHVSFSRDHQKQDEPRYVQDNIKLNGESVAEWITENDAVVYVCGDAKCMGKNVNEALADVLVECKGMLKAEATAYLMKMRLHRRYLEDVWT